jgi:hypothetical protein
MAVEDDEYCQCITETTEINDFVKVVTLDLLLDVVMKLSH